MSKSVKRLLAEAPADDEEKKTGEETPAEETPAAEDPEDGETPPAEETPAEEAPADDNPDDDPDDEEAECGDDRKALAALAARCEALERRLDAMEAANGKMRAMLADPSFAAAAAKTTRIPAAGDASPTLSRAAANAAYAKLKTARERADYRKAHAAELGLRPRA